MLIVTNNQFRSWLKSAANMKLSSNASVLRIIYEIITNFQFLMDFDRDQDSIKSISKYCNKNIDAIVVDFPTGISAKNAVPGMKISTISIRRLVVATNAVKYCNKIGQKPDFENMRYVNVLGEFNTDFDT